jgi:hypothetical protein
MVTQRALLLVACIWTLSSCMPRRADVPSAALPAPAAEAEVPAGARILEIDPDRSVVTMLVRRSGPLARLGHNHVITSAQESGRAWLGPDPSESGFEIRLPVSAFVVDDPAARLAAGAEFPGELPAEAREGTYRNMLRAEVLDGEAHPAVVVRAGRISGTWQQPVVVARITLRGTTREIEVPVELQIDTQSMLAKGALRIRQSDFGITPFSVGGGAIQVADEVDVRFEIYSALVVSSSQVPSGASSNAFSREFMPRGSRSSSR